MVAGDPLNGEEVSASFALGECPADGLTVAHGTGPGEPQPRLEHAVTRARTIGAESARIAPSPDNGPRVGLARRAEPNHAGDPHGAFRIEATLGTLQRPAHRTVFLPPGHTRLLAPTGG
jgi:hypothetical protein